MRIGERFAMAAAFILGALLLSALVLASCAKKVTVAPPAPTPQPPATSTSVPCLGAPLAAAADCGCYQAQTDGSRLLVQCAAVQP